jgi:CubicO group peptidase (beta-lactamase class C family)
VTQFASLIDDLTTRLARHPRLGAQLYASVDGVPKLDAALGEARPGIPLTSRSLLFLSCAAKPLLTAAVGVLVAREQLSFDDPVAAHLPEFAVGGKERITVEDVLTHSGGFRAFGRPAPYLQSYETVSRRVLATPLEDGWRPGTDQGYHQETGWYTLAALVERITGRSYPDVVREDVCVPLGMDSTWLTLERAAHAARQDRLAIPSTSDDAGARREPFYVTRSACGARVPPYGGYGVMRDLARFHEAALAVLSGAGGTGFPVPRPVLARLVESPHGTRYDRTWDRTCAYGRGFLRDLSGHWGFGSEWSPASFGTNGMIGHVYVGADPETGVVVAASLGGLVGDWADCAELTGRLYRGAQEAA